MFEFVAVAFPHASLSVLLCAHGRVKREPHIAASTLAAPIDRLIVMHCKAAII